MSEFKYEMGVCAIFKNEAKYLKEWIEYHILMGVEIFYLYNNNSNDNPEIVLKGYIEQGIVKYHNYTLNLGISKYPEPWCRDDYPYNNCTEKYKNETKWIAYIDVDEFIVLYQNKKLPEFMKEYANYAALAINWVMFGSSGNYMEPEGLVIENYTLRQTKDHGANKLTKSIVNPRKISKWQGPHLPVTQHKIVRENFKEIKDMCQPPIHNRIAIFHYYPKSKSFYIFCKMSRMTDISILRGNIAYINPDKADKNKNLSELCYNNPFTWDFYNDISINCIDDNTLSRFIHLLRNKLGITSKTTNKIINYSYYSNCENFKKYESDNKHLFLNKKNSLLFHYNFLIDNNTNPDKNLYITPPSIDYNKYNSIFFIDYLKKFAPFEKQSVIYSPKIAYKFYIDHELFLPPDFDPLYYSLAYPDTPHLNHFEAIVHWLTIGQSENRLSYTSPFPHFDWKFYTQKYSDLSSLSPQEAVMHWVFYGRFEHRLTSHHPIPQVFLFDPIFYTSHYLDLSHLSPRQAFIHWLRYGRFEKRLISLST